MISNHKIAESEEKDMQKEPLFADYTNGDIVRHAMFNNFDGVNSVLQVDQSMINAQEKQTGITALMGASGRGLEAMVDYLLSQPGVDIELVDFSGHTALEHAVNYPNIVAKIMRFKHPQVKWSEPKINPV